jgi:hypothetical protein
MAIYDCTTPAQAEVYIRAANRTRLAGQAMPLLTKWTEQESSFVAPASPTLSHRNEIKWLDIGLAGVEGLEPPTPGFGDREDQSRPVLLHVDQCGFSALHKAHGAARCCLIPAGCVQFGSKIGSNRCSLAWAHYHFDNAAIDVTVPEPGST